MSDSNSEISIRVIPNASRNEIVGVLDGALKVKVQAPPEGGRANKCVIQVLSKEFNIPKRTVTILSGEKSRNKRVCLEGVSQTELDVFLSK
jgi:hypothetical protein